MANCPNCGSDHIQIKRETDINWGRALVGYAAFGVVGGAVGAVTGEDRNANGCLDCGCTWKAEDLYKLLQLIKQLTNEKLNLALEEDRAFMNSFISEVSPYIENLSKVESQNSQSITDAQKKVSENDSSGCSYGCALFFFAIVIIPLTGSATLNGSWFFGSLFVSLIVVGLGQMLAASNKAEFEKEVEVKKKESNKNLLKAEDALNAAVAKFMAEHS